MDEEIGDVLQLTTEENMQRYKIHLRPTNHALIKSAKRIKLGGISCELKDNKSIIWIRQR